MDARELLNIAELRTGDLIFSTTAGVISLAIRSATRSSYSHASIYLRDGVIVEANDDGVGPRRIRPLAIAEGGGLVGLPYDDWTSVYVLRSPADYTAADWEIAMTAALDEQLGLDFPPLSVMSQGAPSVVALFAVPLAASLDVVDWLRNREPMAYDSWCSRLVGHVLSNQFAHRLTVQQRLALGRASPQRLLELAEELGYTPVPASICRGMLVHGRVFEDARNALAPAQEATYAQWWARAQQHRGTIRSDKSYELLRLIAKRLGVLLLLLIASGIAITWLVNLDAHRRPDQVVARAAEIRTIIAGYESEIDSATREMSDIEAQQASSLVASQNRMALISRLRAEIRRLDQNTAQGKRETERLSKQIDLLWQLTDGELSLDESMDLARRNGLLSATIDRKQREIDALTEALARLAADAR